MQLKHFKALRIWFDLKFRDELELFYTFLLDGIGS